VRYPDREEAGVDFTEYRWNWTGDKTGNYHTGNGLVAVNADGGGAGVALERVLR